MDGAGAPMPSWMELWNEWEIQVVVVASFSLQVILFFFAGIRRYNVSFVLKVLLWLVYLLADLVAMYALGHMSSLLSKKSSSEKQLMAFWAPFLLLHLGGQDTITAYALEDNELWLRHLLNMFVQVACTTYVLYKYIIVGGAAFVPAAMWVLAAGVVKYGERIWALKRATKKGSPNIQRLTLLQKIYGIYRRLNPFVKSSMFLEPVTQYKRWINARDCFPKSKQFGTYAFIVMTAHALRHILVKPLIMDRNEESIDWNHPDIDLLKGHVRGNGEPPIPVNGHVRGNWKEPISLRAHVPGNLEEPASVTVKMKTGQVYKAIEVEFALMYDMLYTKAQVIHIWYGYCARVFSLLSCFAALRIFTSSKRDGYSTPDIVITFALLGGACTLEVASVLKVIGSTWTYDILQGYGWKWLPNAILFTRYHLVVVKDGRWSDSVGQFNFTSFCVHSSKKDLKRRIAKWIGLKDLWDKAHCTKHAKLSPALKEHVWDLLKGGDKSHMVQIEDVAIRSGYWARRFSGFEQSQQLDWTMSFEFQKSVLIWHIATDIFLSNSAVKPKLVDNKMGEAVNTLSDYMMYLLVEHPDILPVKANTQNLVHQARISYSNDLGYSNINDVLKYKKERSRNMKKLYGDWTQEGWDDHPGEAVVVKACTLAETMLDMELGLTHKMVIIGTVWMEMLCYAATNASGRFHARQLSNGGEFLTHILLLTEYCSAITGVAEFREIEDLNRPVSDSERLTNLVLHLSQDIPDPNYTRQDSPLRFIEDEKYTYVPKRRKRKAGKPSKAADCAAGHIELTVDDSNDEITEIG